MNRAALRLATVAALTGGLQEPWPTMAKQLVYDSRNDAFSDETTEGLFPTVVVYTDRDDKPAATGSTARAGASRSVDLRIEMAITTLARDDEGVLIAGWPETDCDLEATLDLFEYQIEAALFGSGPWALWWRDLFSSTGMTSERFADGGHGKVRLAARQLILNVKLAADCLPPPRASSEPAPAASMSGLWRKVAGEIEARGSSDLKTVLQRMTAVVAGRGLPQGVAYPALSGIRMNVRGTKPGAETALEAELSETLPTQP